MTTIRRSRRFQARLNQPHKPCRGRYLFSRCFSRVSRQALYLHFADRAALFVAVSRFADQQRGLSDAIRTLQASTSGVAAMKQMVAMQAEFNPGILPLARLLDGLRRSDAAADASWQDRLADRLDGCRAIVARLEAEGSLRDGLAPDTAADLLWTLTSLRTWEELVVERGWTSNEYTERITAALSSLLLHPTAFNG